MNAGKTMSPMQQADVQKLTDFLNNQDNYSDEQAQEKKRKNKVDT